MEHQSGTTQNWPIHYKNALKSPDTARTDSHAIAQEFNPGPRLETEIIIYIQEVGTELRPYVTIKGEINTKGGPYPFTTLLPQHTDFSAEHNGLGRMVMRKVITTRGMPPDFRAFAYETNPDNGYTKWITDRTMDWGTAPDEWFSGFWWWTDWNSVDENYKGHVAWGVKQV